MRAEELSMRATVPPSEVPGYRLERLLGQGAFGQVWVGKNLNTGRTVAVKFYLHRSGVNWSLLSREVKHLVSMASNRFIVQVLEVGWDAEPPYYVMEFLENGSLDDLIRSKGNLSVKQASEIFYDLAVGLNHSHGKGVLHCDLKPANVLLDQDMRPRLADFGQSRMSHEQTPSLGTLFYMAPEQADLNAVPDARWDVYALGAILYCMLTGNPPYRTPDMVSTLDTAANLPERLKKYRDALLKSPAPRQHYRVPRIDRELSKLIDRCLAKHPDDRLANVQQVLEELEKRQVNRMRRPLLMLGIVGPVVLLLVMAFFSWKVINTAKDDSAKSLRGWSLRSNEFAAKFAAQTLESEIASLFRLLADEASRSNFRERVERCQTEAGPELLASLLSPSASSEMRDRFLALESRTQLESYLQGRLQRILSSGSQRSKSTKFSSLFVLDDHGTNLATAMSEVFDESPVGRNFAYRSYFNGLREDQPKDSDRSQWKPTAYPHISVPFRSTSTGRWKVAVCAPIVDDEDQIGNSTSVRGVLVLTINLGDFELLAANTTPPSDRSTDDDPSNHEGTRFAVLIDGHAGNREGTLLQHPALESREVDAIGVKNLANSTQSVNFQIDAEQLQRLKKGGLYDYQDPVAKAKMGQEFGGKWIAAMQRVAVPRISMEKPANDAEVTDLWVLVQERAEVVTEPVDLLGRKLLREGLIALLTLLTVVGTLWVFVLRFLQNPDSMPAGPGNRSGGDTGTGTDATISIS